MSTTTTTGTLAAGSSKTFNLAPGSALSLTLSPNVRVTITETPESVSGSGVGGNTTRVHEPQLPGTFAYGPYAMGGVVVVAVASNSGSSVTWTRKDTVVTTNSDGTSLVSGDGTEFPIVTSNDGTRDILRMAAGSWLQLGVSSQGAGKELVNFTATDINASSVARPTLVYVEQTASPDGAGTFDFHGLDVKTSGGLANANFSANTGFYAVEGKTQFTPTAAQTLGKSVGVFGSSQMNGASGTLTLSVGVQGETQQTGAGTTTAAAAFYAKTPTITAGSIATAYGMFIQDITGATNNFAIQSNAGRILFHSNVAPVAGGSFKVGVMMSSTNAFGIFFGSGAPTLSAAQGSLYMRTDGTTTNDRMYVNTNGTTGWTAVTTAA